MKHILATLMLAMLALPTFAEEQPKPTTPPTPPTTTQSQDVTPKESTSIIDFCRTHTC